MTKKECCQCGKEYNVEFARRIVDDDYGLGRYDWICNFCGDLCLYCASEELSLKDENGNEVRPEAIIYPGIND